MSIQDLFFELIRVAIGTQESLSRLPSHKEWEALYDMATKQSIVGVCFAALQRLGADADEGFARIGMSEILYLTWMGMAVTIQQRNEHVNQQCAELQAKLTADGFSSCLLKGQGVATLYRGDLYGLRQSGDIDIWVDGDRDQALDWVRKQGAEVSYIDSVHSHASLFEDTAVEVHSRPSWMYSRKGDKVFMQYWMTSKDEQMMHKDERLSISYPKVEFNLVHSLLHINRHIFEEGIGFRQLMDYYFILMASSKEERSHAIDVLSKMNLKRFARGIMYIEQKVFGLDAEKMLWNADDKEGEFLLADILAGGNFGKHDARTKTFRLDDRWKRGWFTIRHNMRYLMHYPSEVLAIPVWKLRHYVWRKKNGYI